MRDTVDQFKKRYGAKVMAYEYLITNEDTWMGFVSAMCDLREETDKPLKIKVTASGKRSLSQNAFQHVIYGEISKYLVSKGRNDWTPAYTKENLKNNFLGWEEKEYIDVKTGVKSYRSVLRSTSKLDKGESYLFTTAILEWSESIGCKIRIPEDSEYMKLKRTQTE
ncbi:hypothetical protein NVP1064O_48 [Vibrio phage 1.064.O._10N.261.52.E2]|nr:hypothetical protein NVP1064O_48 [Vibrio phage 1.064.O._10N.261.52.E2]AUR86501.1 hypothetical protein NVP1085O_50 [Vibrio phage 1.085.O._10N.222.51.E3]AUR88114.1 hypothetical protein NVP1108O_48 [Vibrio phage 1.108.O._10N.222.51.A4]